MLRREQRRPDHRDVATAAGSCQLPEPRRLVVLRRVGLHQLLVEEAGQAEREQVEHDAEDDLVDQVADREARPAAARSARRRARPATRPTQTLPAMRADQRAGERADQQLALDRHVDDAGALAEHAGQRAEDQRQGAAMKRAADDVDQRHEVLPGRRRGDLPAQERQHERRPAPTPSSAANQRRGGRPASSAAPAADRDAARTGSRRPCR